MENPPKKIVIAGLGGFAAEVAWLIADINASISMRQNSESTWRIEAFIGSLSEYAQQTFENYRVISESQLCKVLPRSTYFAVAIGDNTIRKKVALQFIEFGFQPSTLIHPSAILGTNVSIGKGGIVMPNAFLAPYASIDDFSIVNSSATIGHHSKLGAFTNICPGARLGGNSSVKEGGLVGSNAVLHPSAELGLWSKLGPSSYLMKNAPDYTSWLGVPAKRFL